MIAHLFKLVWNQKRANALLVTQILLSFLVVFVLVTAGAYYADNYRRPLGFSHAQVWSIDFMLSIYGTDRDSSETQATIKQLYLALQDFSEVEAIGGITRAPFEFKGGSSRQYTYEDRTFRASWEGATDGIGNVLKLDLVRGRWFEKSDDVRNPIVITQKFSDEIFGLENPLGKRIQCQTWGERKRGASGTEMQIVGVLSDFRQDGDLARPENFVFHRINMDVSSTARPPGFFLIRVGKKTAVDFEEKLAKKLRAVARDWSFDIQPLSQRRAAFLKWRLVYFFAAGLVAVLLMCMVGLSLMGVMWQRVIHRTMEIGLRRALGGSIKHIYVQFLGELLVVTTIAIAIGAALVVQFPLPNLFLIGSIGGEIYAYSFAISLIIIYLLAILCCLYPGRMATRIHPVEALHCE